MNIIISKLERKYFAFALITILCGLIFILSLPFLPGVSGGVILFVLLRPLFNKIVSNFNHKTFVAILLMALSFLVIIIPLSFAVYSVLTEFIKVLQSEEFYAFLSNLPFDFQDFKFNQFLQTHITTISDLIRNFSFNAFGITVNALLNLFVMYLILFYLLIQGESVYEAVLNMIPFKKENSKKLISEEEKVIKSTIVSNGIVSIIIGILFTTGLYIAGYDNLFFWLSLSVILAFIPVVGIQFIWIPMGIYLFYMQEYSISIGLVIWGAFLSFFLDVMIRQFIQKRVGEINPFISLIGLIIGVMYFGMTGIVIGPFLFSLTYTSLKLYRQEHGK